MDLNIQHNEKERIFFCAANGKDYVLEYNVVKPNLWEFLCSYLPRIVTNLKEIEIRENIIEYALSFMKENNIQLMESGSCLEVRDYLDRKKDLNYLVRYVI